MPPCTDHMGLMVTTESSDAAARYAEGVQLLVCSSPDAGRVLRAAVAADDSLGVAVAALAWSAAVVGGDVHVVLEALERCRAASISATRRERQHMELISVALRGDRERARALGCDHLREFPADVLVAYLVVQLSRPGMTSARSDLS